MRLRDLKLGVPGGSGPKAEFPSGEKGVLNDVQYLADSSSMPARLNLVIEFEGDIYSRHLFDTDTDLLKSLYLKVKGCVGLPISQILDRGF